MAVELTAAGSCYRALLLAINVVFFVRARRAASVYLERMRHG
jgi:predicted LPLAT superfamily acyltransferase